MRQSTRLKEYGINAARSQTTRVDGFKVRVESTAMMRQTATLLDPGFTELEFLAALQKESVRNALDRMADEALRLHRAGKTRKFPA